ncbi:ATP-binding protein [Pseudoalteromonas sp. SYSU M81236]|jgi:signal transduction histidine kinase
MIIGFTITLILGASTSLHVMELKEQTLLNMSEKADAIVSPMLSEIKKLTKDNSVGSWVMKVQGISLKNILKNNTFDDLKTIYFIDQNNFIAAHPDNSKVDTLETNQQILKQLNPALNTIIPLDEQYVVSVPINSYQNENIGYVIVSFSDTDLAAKTKAIISNAVSLFAIYLLTALIIAYIIIRRIILQPIEQLVEFSHAVTTGDLNCPINIKSQDEIGTLASGFKMMRAAVRQQINSMHEQHSLLEETVAKRTQEYLDAKEQAEQSNQAKSRFLANMSHELRTPLNAVLGFSQLLQDSETDKNKRRYLEAISISGNSLLNVLNDILDLSKVDAGKMQLDIDRVEIPTMCHELNMMFLQLSAQKDLELQVTAHPDLTTPVLLDSNKLRQVLTNLIGNAIKFTSQGSVKVFFDFKTHNDNSHIDIKVHVKDTGKGIPSDQQELIFNDFEQVQGQRSSEFGGTGLGLAISLRFIKLMGGELSVISEKDRGSEFIVSIPNVELAESKNEVEHRNYPAISSYHFNPARILIVDDIPYNREYLESFLSRWSFTIDTAINGEDALMKIEQNQPDLIIMDLKMPVMGGLEASQLIRSDDRFKHIPIIAVTASAIRDDKVQSSILTDYIISKPIYREHLIFIIAQYLD